MYEIDKTTQDPSNGKSVNMTESRVISGGKKLNRVYQMLRLGEEFTEAGGLTLNEGGTVLCPRLNKKESIQIQCV